MCFSILKKMWLKRIPPCNGSPTTMYSICHSIESNRNPKLTLAVAVLSFIYKDVFRYSKAFLSLSLSHTHTHSTVGPTHAMRQNMQNRFARVFLPGKFPTSLYRDSPTEKNTQSQRSIPRNAPKYILRDCKGFSFR